MRDAKVCSKAVSSYPWVPEAARRLEPSAPRLPSRRDQRRDGRWKNVDYPEVIDRATYDG
jgi:hypothetical protein